MNVCVCVRVLYDNWSLQQHSSPSPGRPGRGLILYISKRTTCTCFMRPFEHLDEVAAQLSISYFHQVTKRLGCSLIISEPLLHQLLCKPGVIVKLLKQSAVSVRPLSPRSVEELNCDLTPKWASSASILQLLGPTPAMWGTVRGECNQMMQCLFMQVHLSGTHSKCPSKCYELKYPDVMFLSTNQREFVIYLIGKQHFSLLFHTSCTLCFIIVFIQ